MYVMTVLSNFHNGGQAKVTIACVKYLLTGASKPYDAHLVLGQEIKKALSVYCTLQNRHSNIRPVMLKL